MAQRFSAFSESGLLFVAALLVALCLSLDVILLEAFSMYAGKLKPGAAHRRMLWNSFC